MPKEFKTDILIGGAVDPSLAKATGLSIKELSRMQSYIKGVNSLAAKSQLAFNGLPPAISKTNQGLQKAAQFADKLHGSIGRIAEIAGGVAIGDLLARGLENAVSLTERLAENMFRFAEYASKAAAQRELMSKGLGNILGNQGLADQVMSSEARTAIESPFLAKDLQQSVKRFVAAGANTKTAQFLANRGGDIVAGVGGDSNTMERYSLAIGKIMASGFMSGQEGRELKDLGIPYEKVLEQILHTDAAGLEKMQKKHLITDTVVMQMIQKLTGEGGMFFEGMKKFAETFTGLETSIHDLFLQGSQDLGDVINDMVKPLAKELVNSGFWKYVYDWLGEFRNVEKSVVSFITSLPSASIADKFDKIIVPLQISWAKFNEWIDKLFPTFTNPATGNIERMVGPQAGEAIKNAIDGITDGFQRLGTACIAFNDKLQGLIGSAERIGGAMGPLIKFFNSIDDLIYGHIIPFGTGGAKVNASPTNADNLSNAQERLNAAVLSGNDAEIEKAKQDLKAAESVQKLQQTVDDLNLSLYRLGGGTGMPGGNYGLHGGLSDNDNAVYYEHYDTEGRSSRYGPHNNRLGPGYGIGLGIDKQSQTGAHYGDWVKVRLSNGRTVVRQVNETSSRRHGIEFETPHTDESSYGSKVESIEKVGGASSVPDVHIHINTLDASSFDRYAGDNAEIIAKHVHRVFRDQMSSSAIV